jgi:hypothetical protein
MLAIVQGCARGRSGRGTLSPVAVCAAGASDSERPAALGTAFWQLSSRMWAANCVRNALHQPC